MAIEFHRHQTAVGSFWPSSSEHMGALWQVISASRQRSTFAWLRRPATTRISPESSPRMRWPSSGDQDQHGNAWPADPPDARPAWEILHRVRIGVVHGLEQAAVAAVGVHWLSAMELADNRLRG